MKALLFFLCFILSGAASGYSGWEPGQPVPDTIAPIRAPFEMPPLQRPVFKDVDYSIRDYGAVECAWGAEKRTIK